MAQTSEHAVHGPVTDLAQRLQAALTGRYRMERELGRGGAAIVFRARDLKHERSVALKVLRPDIALALGADRFLREIKIAANLSHPHVLPVLDSGRAGDFLFYVMPVLEGETLRSCLARRGVLSIDEALGILHDVLDAIHHAHRRGIIHRDIKPENVFLSGRHALVMDFGVAKALSVAASPDADTKGVVLGTPAYMAPEQAAADPSIDHRADLYSVGILAYEMLTGHPPFRGESPQAVLAAQVTQEATPVAQLRPDLPAALTDFTMRLLEKRPADRFQTADIALQQLGAEVTPTRGSGALPTTQALEPVTPRRRGLKAALVALAVVLLVGAGWLLGASRSSAPLGRPVLAVMPFENLGPPEDEYFANGITDAITARLAGLANVGVISRTSAMQFKGTALTAQQVAQELGVDYILEGTIQRERPSDPSSRLRVIPQLIRASDDTHLWASVYDGDMTAVFRVQTEIAEHVAQAMNVTLAGPEHRSLVARPTESLEAYEVYLRGHEYLFDSPGSGNANARRIAAELFERAIALDSTFALAYAELSLAHMWLYHYFIDRSDGRYGAAKRAVDRALALDPDLPTVHLALGHIHYWGPDPDPQQALREFEHVVEREPNNAYARNLLAVLLAAQGDWDRAVVNAALAAELDPREPDWAASAARLQLYTRQYAEAERFIDRALRLAPDMADAHRVRIALYLRWAGDMEKSRGAVQQMRAMVTPGEVAVALVEVAPMLVATGQYDSLYDDLTPSSLVARFPFDYLYTKAEYFRLRRRPNRARVYYDSLLSALDAVPEDQASSQRVAMFRGRALVGLGREAEVAREALRIEALIQSSQNAMQVVAMRGVLVRMYAEIGRHGAALDHLEALLAGPSPYSIPYLRVDELPAALRSHPRYQQLLKRAGPNVA